jgi:Flp pilus assembly protein TadG
MHARRHRQGGATMIEFAIVGSIFFVLIFLIIDFGRAISINTSVSDAARQAARQVAANALSADNPFSSTPTGQCPGTVLSRNASGTGCLTDAQLKNTVASVLKDLTPSSSITLFSNTPPSSCNNPPQGQVYVCVSPSEAARQAEWSTPTGKGTFNIQVTVKFTFKPWTPVINVIGSSFTLSSTSSTVAEY